MELDGEGDGGVVEDGENLVPRLLRVKLALFGVDLAGLLELPEKRLSVPTPRRVPKVEGKPLKVSLVLVDQYLTPTATSTSEKLHQQNSSQRFNCINN